MATRLTAMSEPSNRKAIRRWIYGAFFDRVIPRGGKGAVKRSPHGAFAGDINDMRQIIGIMGTTAAITPPLRTLTSGGVTGGVVHWGVGVTSGPFGEGKDDHSDLEGRHGRPVV
jgi:hypothetical protein